MEFSPSRFICCGLQQSPCSPRLWQGLSSVPYHRFVCKAALAASPERPALFASPLRPSQSSPSRHLSITGEVHLISHNYYVKGSHGKTDTKMFTILFSIWKHLDSWFWAPYTRLPSDADQVPTDTGLGLWLSAHVNRFIENLRTLKTI